MKPIFISMFLLSLLSCSQTSPDILKTPQSTQEHQTSSGEILSKEKITKETPTNTATSALNSEGGSNNDMINEEMPI